MVPWLPTSELGGSYVVDGFPVGCTQRALSSVLVLGSYLRNVASFPQAMLCDNTNFLELRAGVCPRRARTRSRLHWTVQKTNREVRPKLISLHVCRPGIVHRFTWCGSVHFEPATGAEGGLVMLTSCSYLCTMLLSYDINISYATWYGYGRSS